MSLLFYGWHIPEHLGILIFAAIMNFYCGLRIGNTSFPEERKKYLKISVIGSLGILFIFKYTNFFVDTFKVQSILRHMGFAQSGPILDIILPMGISFFTFQMMSYTIDIYRRELKPIARFSHFLFYVSFFPHLVAGPIVRAKEFLYQVGRSRSFSIKVFSHGSYLIIKGLFLKMVIADNIGYVVNQKWSAAASVDASSLGAIIIALLFSFQIYCDFDGYSTIARGISYQLGFRLPINFLSPYIAGSFQDFWRRWHISLSSWLRDYLYIPLGGNKGSAKRTGINLLLVMLLGGLWHGAAFTFIVWGAIHGTALLIERYFQLNKRAEAHPLTKFFYYIAVQFVVLIAWVYFRSPNLTVAKNIIKNFFSFNLNALPEGILLPLVLIIPPVLMHLKAYLQEKKILSQEPLAVYCVYAVIMIFLIFTCYGRSFDFIYLQF